MALTSYMLFQGIVSLYFVTNNALRADVAAVLSELDEIENVTNASMEALSKDIDVYACLSEVLGASADDCEEHKAGDGGIVYLCRKGEQENQPCAIKITFQTEEASQALEQEIAIQQRASQMKVHGSRVAPMVLNHNLGKKLNEYPSCKGEDDFRMSVFVMEMMDGDFEDGAPTTEWDEHQLAAAVWMMEEKLVVLNKNHICHGDVKHANVMHKGAEVFFVDFGASTIGDRSCDPEDHSVFCRCVKDDNEHLRSLALDLRKISGLQQRAERCGDLKQARREYCCNEACGSDDACKSACLAQP